MQGCESRKFIFYTCDRFGSRLLKNVIIDMTTSLELVLLNISSIRSKALISKKYLTYS
jgi:hypothetical protein